MFPYGVENANGPGKALSKLVARVVKGTHLVEKRDAEGNGFGFAAETEQEDSPNKLDPLPAPSESVSCFHRRRVFVSWLLLTLEGVVFASPVSRGHRTERRSLQGIIPSCPSILYHPSQFRQGDGIRGGDG